MCFPAGQCRDFAAGHTGELLFQQNRPSAACRHGSFWRIPTYSRRRDAAMIRGTDRYAWASCYLQDMSKAVIDDVVKVLEAPGSQLA
ncbi:MULTISPECIES: DUF3077 domain-containing protein [Pseudomonas fluorescens group]